MDSGNFSNDTQCISRPLRLKKADTTPAFRHFEKNSKIEKTTGDSLSKGYKIWSAKRKLNYEDGCEEKEPPKKRALKSSRVINLRCSGICFFPSSEDQNYCFDRSRSLGLKSGSDFHQQTAAKNLQETRVVDLQKFAQVFKECLFCKGGKYG